MTTRTARLLELLGVELGAAAQSARDIRTRLKVVRMILMDIPQVVTVDDVTALLTALHGAEAIEQSLNDLRAQLERDAAPKDGAADAARAQGPGAAQ
jgi:hypothetical protein